MEMLVTVAIMAVLSALLFPSISRSIDRARLVTCTQNLRNCYTAINLYAVDHDGTYPPVNNTSDSSAPAHWAYAVAPYMGAATADYNGMMSVISKMVCPLHGTVLAARLKKPSMKEFRNLAMNFSLGPSSLVKEYRKVTFVTKPAQTMLLTEAGLPGNGSTSTQIDKTMLVDSAKDQNGIYTGGVHGGANNIIWVDGHISLFYDVQQLTTGQYNYGQPMDAWAGGGQYTP